MLIGWLVVVVGWDWRMMGTCRPMGSPYILPLRVKSSPSSHAQPRLISYRTPICHAPPPICHDKADQWSTAKTHIGPDHSPMIFPIDRLTFLFIGLFSHDPHSFLSMTQPFSTRHTFLIVLLICPFPRPHFYPYLLSLLRHPMTSCAAVRIIYKA